MVDSMEQGCGIVIAMHQRNEYRDEEGILDVGISNTHHTLKCIGPVLRRERRRKQGNKDPTSPWAKSQLRWATQLLVRLGKHAYDNTAKRMSTWD
jgi:hypothetical protein